MILKFIRISSHLYPVSSKLYTFSSEIPRYHQNKFLMKINDCQSSSQLQNLYLKNINQLTNPAYLEIFCQQLILKAIFPYTHIRFANPSEKDLISNVCKNIIGLQPDRITIRNLMNFTHFYRTLYEKNYYDSYLQNFLIKNFKLGKIKQQTAQLSLKQLATLYNQISRLNLLRNYFNPILFKKLIETTKNFTPETYDNYVEIEYSLLKILEGISNIDIYQGAREINKIINYVFKITKDMQNKIDQLNFVQIVHFFYDPQIKYHINSSEDRKKLENFKEKAIEIIYKLESFDFNKLIFKGKRLGSFKSPLQKHILNKLMKCATQQGKSSIDLLSFLKYIRFISEYHCLNKESYDKFFRLLFNQFTKYPNQISSTLSFLQDKQFWEIQGYRTIYQLALKNKQVILSVGNILFLSKQKFDITELILRTIKKQKQKTNFQKIIHKDKYRNLMDNSLLAKELQKQEIKNPQIIQWCHKNQAIITQIAQFQQSVYEIFNLHTWNTHKKIKQFIKFYGHLFQPKIIQVLLSHQKQNPSFCFRYICMNFPKMRRNDILNKISQQERIKMLLLWKRRQFYNYMIEPFLEVLLDNIGQDFDGQNFFIEFITSTNFCKLINPSEVTNISIYASVIQKLLFLAIQTNAVYDKLIYYLYRNNFRFIKSSYFYRICEKMLKEYPNMVPKLKRSLQIAFLDINLLTLAQTQQINKSITNQPEKRLTRIADLLQVTETITAEQFNQISEKILLSSIMEVQLCITKFNLANNKRNKDLLKLLITKFENTTIGKLQNVNFMAIIENLKRVVKRGFQQQYLVAVVRKMVNQMVKGKISTYIFLEDQLYLLQNARNLKIQINWDDQFVMLFINNLQTLKPQSEIYRRVQQIIECYNLSIKLPIQQQKKSG